MGGRQRVGAVLLAVACGFLLLRVAGRLPPRARPALAAPATGPPAPLEATGIRALDGDSIRARLMAGGAEVEVRLLGVDAPEKDQPLADDARRFSDARVRGQRLRLVPGRDARDRYGRLLCWVETGGRLLNAELAGAGLAVAYLYPPNLDHADRILLAQKEAHAAARGLWGTGGPYEEPRSFRERRRRGGKGPRRDLDYARQILVGNRRSGVAHLPGCRHVDGMASATREPLESLAEARDRGYRLEKGAE